MKKLLSSLFIVTLLATSLSAFATSPKVQEIVKLKKELEAQSLELEKLDAKLQEKIELKDDLFTYTLISGGATAIVTIIGAVKFDLVQSLVYGKNPVALTIAGVGVVATIGLKIYHSKVTAITFETQEEKDKFQEIVNQKREEIEAKIKALSDAEMLELHNL